MKIYNLIDYSTTTPYNDPDGWAEFCDICGGDMKGIPYHHVMDIHNLYVDFANRPIRVHQKQRVVY